MAPAACCADEAAASRRQNFAAPVIRAQQRMVLHGIGRDGPIDLAADIRVFIQHQHAQARPRGGRGCRKACGPGADDGQIDIRWQGSTSRIMAFSAMAPAPLCVRSATSKPCQRMSILAIVGAGPAGLAAAATAARAGLSVLMLDENSNVGGQIYRAIATNPVKDHGAAGHGLLARRSFGAGRCRFVGATCRGAIVWSVAPMEGGGYEIGVVDRRPLASHHGARVMLATGALERPFSDSGLDAARRHELRRGADRAQGLWPVPDGRIVIAGCGPLLWLIAWQYLNAGVFDRRHPRHHAARESLLPHAEQALRAIGAHSRQQARRSLSRRDVSATEAKNVNRRALVTDKRPLPDRDPLSWPRQQHVKTHPEQSTRVRALLVSILRFPYFHPAQFC